MHAAERTKKEKKKKIQERIFAQWLQEQMNKHETWSFTSGISSLPIPYSHSNIFNTVETLQGNNVFMEAVTFMELLKLKAMVKIICNMLLYSS